MKALSALLVFGGALVALSTVSGVLNSGASAATLAWFAVAASMFFGGGSLYDW